MKLILMSTTGYTNTLSEETNSMREKIILFFLGILLPPHRDNIKAANYLVRKIGRHNEKIEWVAVRPDTLVNSDDESPYEVYEAPIRSPIFDAGTTSRINVSRFMVELLTNKELWKQYQYMTPVIYNA